MQSEKRKDSRIEVKGLICKISIEEPNGSLLIGDANLLNVSQSGIKLRVKKPLIADINTRVQIEVILPMSRIPVIVNAGVVDSEQDSEFGMQYIDLRPEDPIEQLIKECKNQL